jgi:hypothetical protein
LADIPFTVAVRMAVPGATPLTRIGFADVKKVAKAVELLDQVA